MSLISSSEDIKNTKSVGGKGQGLNFLSKNGFSVPCYYVLSFNLVDKILNGEISVDKLLLEWKGANEIKEDQLWAIRSSGNLEDGKSQSYAGLFKTELNIKTNKLEHAVNSVLEAYKNIHKLNYEIAEGVKFAIIIQEMIVSEFSGVMFSHNPNDLNEDEIYINILPGIGENLVSGKEAAFSVKIGKNKVSFLHGQKEFNGQIFNGGLKDVCFSEEEIKNILNKHQKELVKGVKSLVKLKAHPVDIEFAIADEKIYWLQVRPITVRKEKQLPIVWDNSNIGDNYPGLSLPLTISFVKYTYLNAYSGMAAFLGMRNQQVKKNYDLLDNMVGGIYGRLYYNVTAWQKLLCQLPFGIKTSQKITSIWAMENAVFDKPKYKASFLSYLRLLLNIISSFIFLGVHKRKFENIYQKAFYEFKNKDYQNISLENLKILFKRINKELGEKWIVPVLNGFFAMLMFSSLKKIVQKSRLSKKYPNFINDILYSQTDVVSVTIVNKYKDIVNEIITNTELKVMFNNNNEEVIWQKLQNYPELKKEIDNYIAEFGERCGEGELKIETVNYKEDPLKFISFLKANTKGVPTKGKGIDLRNYKTILRKEYKYNLIKRFFLVKLIKLTLNRIRDRENYRFYRTKGFDLVRKILRAMDRNLYENGLIECVGDSYYLQLNEILDDKYSSELKSIIRERQDEYKYFIKQKTINRYHQIGDKFVPVELHKLGNISGSLKGIGCSSGRVIQKAMVVTESNVNSSDFEGKILVANYFEPGWINLFSKAAGIISERGSLLCHTAILCREMGIPAIVGAKGIVASIKEETIIKMDGGSGEIKLS